MRVRYWLFTISVLLFVSGIGFIIAAERTRKAAPAAATVEAPPAAPTASVKQIMKGLTGPAANVIFGAVSIEIGVDGEKEKAPQSDEEWAEVATSAAMLVESANMLMQGSRAVDRGDWVKMATQMATAGKQALKEAEARNKDGILTVGESVNMSCDNCHARYLRN
jgi:hypothetical protein